MFPAVCSAGAVLLSTGFIAIGVVKLFVKQNVDGDIKSWFILNVADAVQITQFKYVM